MRLLSDRFAASEGVERVGGDPAPGRPQRYSTSELIGLEEAALAVADRGQGVGAPAVSDELVTATGRDGLELSEEQEQMVQNVCMSPDRVVCVVGLTGAGKTTATRALVDVYRAAGVPVLGAAPSGVAARQLQDETGAGATTLHRLIRETDEAGLPVGCVLVVGEAGMADTRTLAPLLERVKRAGGKAVLIGDPSQLPAVGAGSLFAGIVERHGAVKLTENRRQRDPAEREALAALRDGTGRDYLAFADGNERLVVSDNPVATKARLLADWWREASLDPAGNVMIALRRRDVAELNLLARRLMDSHGRLGDQRLTLAGREFAPGDRVVCLRNDTILDVNGTRGTIQHVDPASRTLTVVTDRGDRVELPRRYLTGGHLRHAYALTGHSGQGRHRRARLCPG